MANELLAYARSLGFTDSQYEEAVKMVEDPTNYNQLLMALMQVSKTAPSISTTTTNTITPNVQRLPDTNLSNSTSSVNSSSKQSNQFLTDSSSSSNNSSLESLQLKKIYIDGSNVARTHGKNLFFSWLGIKLCVDWFRNRHHRVKAFVPADKCQTDGPDQQVNTNKSIINYLNSIDALVVTPTGHNDDFLIIEAARHNNGIIVSNDLFRDEKKYDDHLKEFIRFNRLPYIFDDDLFIPVEDPLGRSRRPFLEEFLRVGSINQQQLSNNNNNINNNSNHKKLARAKSYQKYPQRNDSVNGHNYNGTRNKTSVFRAKSHTG